MTDILKFLIAICFAFPIAINITCNKEIVFWVTGNIAAKMIKDFILVFPKYLDIGVVHSRTVKETMVLIKKCKKNIVDTYASRFWGSDSLQKK